MNALCTGCDFPQERCDSSGYGRKCCPDCRHPQSWVDQIHDTYPGVFGPVNSCCGVTASVGHGLYCDVKEADL